MAKGTCIVEGCDRTNVFARGWCRVHWNQWRRYGDPLIRKREPGNPAARFWPRADKTETCWNWTDRVSPDGYGRFWWRDKNWLAHRLAYTLANGDIPDGREIDHLCHNRRCVNPDHLRLVTHKQNMEHHNGPTSLNRSGVRGVHWNRGQRKWRAEVNHNGRRYSAGYFSSIADAEQAVIALRNELHTHNDLDRAAS